MKAANVCRFPLTGIKAMQNVNNWSTSIADSARHSIEYYEIDIINESFTFLVSATN